MAFAGFRTAIQENGVRHVACAFLLQGRVTTLSVDISTTKRQLEALRECDRLEAQLFGGRSVEPPSSTVEDEDTDVVVVDNPARPDSSMAVRSAAYNEAIHGVNGSRMKQKLFTSLFGEYARLLEEKLQTDPMKKLKKLEIFQMLYYYRVQCLLFYSFWIDEFVENGSI